MDAPSHRLLLLWVSVCVCAQKIEMINCFLLILQFSVASGAQSTKHIRAYRRDTRRRFHIRYVLDITLYCESKSPRTQMHSRVIEKTETLAWICFSSPPSIPSKWRSSIRVSLLRNYVSSVDADVWWRSTAMAPTCIGCIVKHIRVLHVQRSLNMIWKFGCDTQRWVCHIENPFTSQPHFRHFFAIIFLLSFFILFVSVAQRRMFCIPFLAVIFNLQFARGSKFSRSQFVLRATVLYSTNFFLFFFELPAARDAILITRVPFPK